MSRVAGAGMEDVSEGRRDGFAPQTVTDNGAIYVVGDLTRGHHVVESGGPGLYALTLSLSSPASPSSSAQVTYEKVSNVEYRVHVISDGPTWIQLSNSYHPLWSARWAERSWTMFRRIRWSTPSMCQNRRAHDHLLVPRAGCLWFNIIIFAYHIGRGHSYRAIVISPRIRQILATIWAPEEIVYRIGLSHALMTMDGFICK